MRGKRQKMSEMNNRIKGSCHEEEAASFLIEKNYTIIHSNYRTKTGEIDLVARDPAGVLVFIEVKYRKKPKKGLPYEAVTREKQRRIYRTAEWYMRAEKIPASARCRFDVISILDHTITHIENAFGGF